MAVAIERQTHPDGQWIITDKRSGLATKEECNHLALSAGRRVVRILRVRSVQGRNDLVEATVLPFGTAPHLARSGVAEERLSIVPASRWVADQLDIPLSSPVLKLDRIVRTASGMPLEWRLTFSPSSSIGGGQTLRRPRAQNR